MKSFSNLSKNFEYELLDESQHDSELREKLAVLYTNPFTDIMWWESRDSSLTSIGYYKLFYYEQSVLKHIILFKYSEKVPKTIMVINQVFHISIENIENISQILFNELPKAKQIYFERLYEPKPKHSPKIIFEKTSNDVIILDVPNSMDSYFKSLGASTRKKINLMKNRIARDIPEFKVYFLENNDISFDQIEKIVSLNRNRMKTKGQKSLLNDVQCNALYQYASMSGFGFLCVCTVNDKIIGGTINGVIGEHAYMFVISHDVKYNQYSVGQIALIHATQYLIEKKNIKYYHLLFGTLDYKFRHGGINHELFDFHVFKRKGVYCLMGKTKRNCRVFYRNLKHILKKNKTFFSFYNRLMKMKNSI